MIFRDRLHLHERIGTQQVHERGWYSQHLYNHTDAEQQDKTYHRCDAGWKA